MGYWKNHSDAWEPTSYLETDLLGDLFLIPAELAMPADDTLAEALRYPGGDGVEGGARLLLRTAVVAVLNAAHPEVNDPLSVPEIVAIVDAALASLDRGTMQNTRHEIGSRNGKGCPLN